MEEVAIAFAIESAKSVLGKIAAHTGEVISNAYRLKDDLKSLHKQLKRMEVLLHGADSCNSTSQEVNPLLEDWLKNVRTVAYQADYVLDEYAYELLRRRIREEWAPRPKHLRLVSSLSLRPVMFRFRMARKVKSLKLCIDEIYADAKDLGIKPVTVATGNAYATNKPIMEEERHLQVRRARVNSEGMIGRDQDQANIVELLCDRSSNDDKFLTIVGICGMAGLGKTALCRSVFRTEEAKSCFDKTIWVCVSHDFDINGILNNMVEQLCEEPSTMSDTDAIINKLQCKLQGKRYLLVLDDVWDTILKEWEPIRCSLRDIGGSKGTTILLTSRSKQVLETLVIPCCGPATTGIDNPYVYQLGSLTADDSWKLFKRRVGDDIIDDERIRLGKNMVQKCGGVPLAIRTLGDLLRSRRRTEEWGEIEKSEIWKEQDDILPSVKLSFKYLPSPSLKRCFVHCATFEEDNIIQKDRLIQLWAAEGFLSPYNTMEQTGEQYFHVLYDNSLFQDPEFDEFGKIVSCKMHDVVHALARVILRQDSNVLLTENNGPQRVACVLVTTVEGATSEIQRLPYDIDHGLLRLGWNLRTFLANIHIGVEKFTVDGKCLRVLSLVGVDMMELPDSIGELKHLRYLEISCYRIKILPDGLTKLHNLQTLRILETEQFPEVPTEFGKLVNLRHLYAKHSAVRISGDLEKFRSAMNFAMGILDNLGKLGHLQTLPPLKLLEDSGGRISELGKLVNLNGTLTIKGLENAPVLEASKVDLGRKDKIENLVLVWFKRGATETNDEMVLQALQPHANLHALELAGYRAKTWPEWVMEMTAYGGSPLGHLVSLTIANCHQLEQLPSLKNLVSLKRLTIKFCCSIISPLDLACLSSLQNWW